MYFLFINNLYIIYSQVEMLLRTILFVHGHQILTLTKTIYFGCHSAGLSDYFYFIHSYRKACHQFEVNIIFSTKQVLYPFPVSLFNSLNMQDNNLFQIKKKNYSCFKNLSRKIQYKYLESFLLLFLSDRVCPRTDVQALKSSLLTIGLGPLRAAVFSSSRAKRRCLSYLEMSHFYQQQ